MRQALRYELMLAGVLLALLGLEVGVSLWVEGAGVRIPLVLGVGAVQGAALVGYGFHTLRLPRVLRWGVAVPLVLPWVYVAVLLMDARWRMGR